MRSPTVAIVGASARAAAHSALRGGMQPVTADLFVDEDLRSVAIATRILNYPHGLANWLSTAKVDGWIYTGALENHPKVVTKLAALRPLWGNRVSVLRQVRCPVKLATIWQAANLCFPETRRSAAGLPLDGSWLCKTYRGSSGSGVWPLDGPLSASHAAATQAVYQRRLEGVPISAVYVAAGGAARVLGSCRQLVGGSSCGARVFQFCGAIGPYQLTGQLLAAVERIGNMAAARFQLVGLFGVDMVHNEDGLWTLEINPRYTASVEVVERTTGIAAITAHIEACLQGQLPTLCPQPSGVYAGKAILFARQPVTVSVELNRWALAGSQRHPWPNIADVPQVGVNIDVGRPVVTLFADGPSASAVKTKLRQRVARTEALLYGPTRQVG